MFEAAERELQQIEMSGKRVLRAGAAALLGAAGLTASAPNAPQGPRTQELQLAQRALEQPGPDHRLPRENAIKDLLNMPVLEAHLVLKNKVVAGDDPDGVARTILAELGRRIANPNNPVFGIPAGDEGRMLVRSYVLCLVSAFIERPIEDERFVALQGPALECLRLMPARERLEGLSAILAPDGVQDLATRRAALRAAARCRDLGLAPLLGRQLSDPDLRPAARQALELLTFQSFADRPAFQSWWQRARELTYLDVVEAKARSADATEAELEQQLIDTAVQLVESWVGQPSATRWQRIGAMVRADDPPGIALACLQKLREILPGNPHGSNAAEQRLELQRALLQRLTQATGADEKALLLETAAYLIRPQGELEHRAVMESQLIQHLNSAERPLRLAALRGLRRFPSAANRAAVVRVAEDGLAAAVAGNDLDTLRTALATLHSPGWQAPGAEDADLGDWLRLLRQVFSAPLTDASLLGEALDVALVKDATGAQVQGVFGVLLDLVGSSRTDPNLRVRALLQLQSWANTDNAERYVAMVLSLLEDEDARIRERAAERLLTSLPAGTPGQQEHWNLLIQDKLRERLLKETSVEVFTDLVAGLRRPDGPENVIGIFKTTIESLPAELSAHRMIVVERLVQEGLDASLDVRLWQLIAGVLLEQGHRDEALRILRKQNAATLAERTNIPDEQVRVGLDLLVRAHLAAPAGSPPPPAEESRQVLAAFAVLEERFNIPRDDADTRLLKLRLHDVLGNDTELIALGGQYLADEVLSSEQGDRVLTLMIRASLRQEAPREALLTYERLSEPGRKGAQAVLVAHDIGKALMQSDPERSADVLAGVVQNTREDSPRFRERFLDLAAARLAIRTENRAVYLMLVDKRTLFEADDCPPAEKARYDELLEAAGT